MNRLAYIFWHWLPLALITTILSGLVYVAVQQNFRQTAYDPQIQIAEDGSALLATGQPPEIFGTSASTDIAHSLQPFTIAYDETGKVISGTGSLNGTIPTPPIGVLNVAKEKGENRLTWQPASGVRIAAVVVHYQGKASGYFLAGRSLREVEHREEKLMIYVFAAWLAALVSSFVVVALRPQKYN